MWIGPANLLSCWISSRSFASRWSTGRSLTKSMSMDHAEFSEIIDEMVERKETHFADCRRWILLGSCTDDDSQRPTPVDCINSRLISLTKHRRVFLHRSRNYSRVFSTH